MTTPTNQTPMNCVIVMKLNIYVNSNIQYSMTKLIVDIESISDKIEHDKTNLVPTHKKMPINILVNYF